MVSFAVDQQTTLVESNEKPNVTPSMLGAWVGFLLASGDDGCAVIGEKVSGAAPAPGSAIDSLHRSWSTGALVRDLWVF